MADKTFRWFAGVDWGSATHQACLIDGAGKVVGERAFAHGGAGLAALCDWLQRFPLKLHRILRQRSSWRIRWA
jgi:Transposase